MSYGLCIQTDTDGFADDVPSVVGYWVGDIVDEPMVKDGNAKKRETFFGWKVYRDRLIVF